MTESLFGHLAYRFSSKPENLATEALNFILNRSHVAREAFVKLLAHVNILLPANLIFETQDSGEDNAIPDLVGKDMDGKTILLGEAKFWAGLTDNQPVAYLRRLIQADGKLLIFFAPSIRCSILWPELQRRCQDAGIELITVDEKSDIRIATVDKEQFLVLISWRALLEQIRISLELEGEREMAGNLTQLQGLCEQMDTTAFLPLQSEELTSGISRRLIQYCDIVDETVWALESEKLISTRGLRASGARSAYIRYFSSQNQGCSLEYNPSLWNKYRFTPIWLRIQSKNWKYDPEARKKLASLEIGESSRLIQDGDSLLIPIYLRTGVEKHALINNMLDQIKEVLALFI